MQVVNSGKKNSQSCDVNSKLCYKLGIVRNQVRIVQFPFYGFILRQKQASMQVSSHLFTLIFTAQRVLIDIRIGVTRRDGTQGSRCADVAFMMS